METIEEIIKKFELEKDKYSASFDPMTGKVISVGPTACFRDITNKIDLDKELAEDVLTGKIQIDNCFINTDSGSLEIAEIKSIRKIDDVIHRIPLLEYADKQSFDIFISYTKKNKQLKIELSKELGGTKKTKNNKKRLVYWSGDTIMDFYITKYNDPHWILHTFHVTLEELQKKSKIYKSVSVPEKFSVFTRRILKDYIIEIK